MHIRYRLHVLDYLRRFSKRFSRSFLPPRETDLTLCHRSNTFLCYRNIKKSQGSFHSALQLLVFHKCGFCVLPSICLCACRVFVAPGRGLNTIVSAYIHLNRKEGDPKSFLLRTNEMLSESWQTGGWEVNAGEGPSYFCTKAGVFTPSETT